MTEIVVATRDGILRAPDGTQTRMVRGRTLADARHPAVRANPNDFGPVHIELNHEEADPGHLEDDCAAELAEAKEDARRAAEAAEGYRHQLTTIADTITAAGLVAPGVDTDQPGWVAESVRHVVELLSGAPEVAAPDDVPPPRSRARKPSAKP